MTVYNVVPPFELLLFVELKQILMLALVIFVKVSNYTKHSLHNSVMKSLHRKQVIKCISINKMNLKNCNYFQRSIAEILNQ